MTLPFRGRINRPDALKSKIFFIPAARKTSAYGLVSRENLVLFPDESIARNNLQMRPCVVRVKRFVTYGCRDIFITKRQFSRCQEDCL